MALSRNLGVLVVGVLIIRALVLGLYMKYIRRAQSKDRRALLRPMCIPYS